MAVGLQRHVAGVRELAGDLDRSAGGDGDDRAEIARRELGEEDVLAVGGRLEDPGAGAVGVLRARAWSPSRCARGRSSVMAVSEAGPGEERGLDRSRHCAVDRNTFIYGLSIDNLRPWPAPRLPTARVEGSRPRTGATRLVEAAYSLADDGWVRRPHARCRRGARRGHDGIFSTTTSPKAGAISTSPSSSTGRPRGERVEHRPGDPARRPLRGERRPVRRLRRAGLGSVDAAAGGGRVARPRGAGASPRDSARR